MDDTTLKLCLGLDEDEKGRKRFALLGLTAGDFIISSKSRVLATSGSRYKLETAKKEMDDWCNENYSVKNPPNENDLVVFQIQECFDI